MKKLFTLLAAAAIGTTAFAQRSLDLKADAIVSPTEIQSTSSGTPFALNIQFSNNSATDSAFAGDTLVYTFHVVSTQSTVITGYPSASNVNSYAFGKILTSDLAPGDTLHLVANLSTQQVATQSFECYIAVKGQILNRPDLVFETSPGSDNNAKLLPVTWWTMERWPVSVQNPSPEEVTVFPNPANNSVTIQALTATANAASVLNVYDINGKLVHTATQVAGNDFNVNTSSFNNGVYVVEVTSGDLVKTSKLVVNH